MNGLATQSLDGEGFINLGELESKEALIDETNFFRDFPGPHHAL